MVQLTNGGTVFLQNSPCKVSIPLRTFPATDDTTKHARCLIRCCNPIDSPRKVRTSSSRGGLRNEKVGCSIHLSGTISSGYLIRVPIDRDSLMSFLMTVRFESLPCGGFFSSVFFVCAEDRGQTCGAIRVTPAFAFAIAIALLTAKVSAALQDS